MEMRFDCPRINESADAALAVAGVRRGPEAGRIVIYPDGDHYYVGIGKLLLHPDGGVEWIPRPGIREWQRERLRGAADLAAFEGPGDGWKRDKVTGLWQSYVYDPLPQDDAVAQTIRAGFAWSGDTNR